MRILASLGSYLPSTGKVQTKPTVLTIDTMGEILIPSLSSHLKRLAESWSPWKPPIYFQPAKCGSSEEGNHEIVSWNSHLPGEVRNIKQCRVYRPEIIITEKAICPLFLCSLRILSKVSSADVPSQGWDNPKTAYHFPNYFPICYDCCDPSEILTSKGSKECERSYDLFFF